MNLIKPEYLKHGDTVAIIAPAGIVSREKIMTATKYFESKDLKVIHGKHLFNEKRYFAGTDEERLEDLHEAFLNPEVNAIVCARGGYGTIRLIDKIDFNIIKNNPKIFCGYSDITALSLMFLKEAGLITYSAPMAQSDFSNTNPDKFTENSFFNVLTGGTEIYKSTRTLSPGCAEGIIWGGNLSTIVSLCGINCCKKNSDTYSFLPDEKFIFFVEDVSEPVYKIDKMFHQLLNIEQFRKNIAGIAFGEFINTDNEDWLKEIEEEISTELCIPAYSGFKFTHAKEKQTVPIGIKGKLDGDLTF